MSPAETNLHSRSMLVVNWPHFVGTLASSLVTAAILAWLLRSANRPPKLAGDAVEIGPRPTGRVC